MDWKKWDWFFVPDGDRRPAAEETGLPEEAPAEDGTQETEPFAVWEEDPLDLDGGGGDDIW
ncbi:hypothetical protein [Intestinimonas sp. HCP28S3_D6]|uniref:hypothetical protein n=1 Tax=Intestinimonas sp. HCP28S3_D6 TaxID=3438942 RepID=UPI003F89ADCB